METPFDTRRSSLLFEGLVVALLLRVSVSSLLAFWGEVVSQSSRVLGQHNYCYPSVQIGVTRAPVIFIILVRLVYIGSYSAGISEV